MLQDVTNWTAVRRGPLAWLALVALLVPAGCNAFGPAHEPAAYETRPWQFGRSEGRQLISEHYVIYTTLDDPRLVDALPDFVEASYQNYQRWVPARKPLDKRMPVYLFKRRGEWAAFTRKFTGPHAEVYLKVRNGGYSARGVSAIQYVLHEVTFPLFAHEGLHQYLYHQVDQRVPAWLNEGLAVACEGQRWYMTTKECYVKEFDPWFNPARRQALEEAVLRERLHPLRHLLRTHPGEILDGTGTAIQTYYAQVWALVLFLREGADGQYAAGFEQLLARLGEGGLDRHARAAHIWSEQADYNYGEALFRGFISDDLDTVEQEYVAFMRDRFVGM